MGQEIKQAEKQAFGGKRPGPTPSASCLRLTSPCWSDEPGTLFQSFVDGILLASRSKGSLKKLAFLTSHLPKLDKGQGIEGRRGGQGPELPWGWHFLFPPSPKLDSSGCRVTSEALQGPHPGSEVGIHDQ
jgi:hypothetical protein